MPSENFSFSLSILSTTASTSSPFLNFSRRVLDLLGPGDVGDVHEAVDALLDADEDAEVGDVADRARHERADRVLLLEHVHGFGSICFMPSEILRSRSSTSSTTASTSSPTLTTFDGCLTRLVHDISETCTRPSMPGSSSTNAP